MANDEQGLTPISTPRNIAVIPEELEKYIESEKKIRKIITAYIKSELKKGTDYGEIEIETKSGKRYKSKPTLFKPGAEKFCAIMYLRPIFKKDEETYEMSGRPAGLFCYLCYLVNQHGETVGEGRGAANLREKINWTENNAIKIAEKRAQIDAVLRTGRLSDFFTQDLGTDEFDDKKIKPQQKLVVKEKDVTKEAVPPTKSEEEVLAPAFQHIEELKTTDELKGYEAEVIKSLAYSPRHKYLLRKRIDESIKKLAVKTV